MYNARCSEHWFWSVFQVRDEPGLEAVQDGSPTNSLDNPLQCYIVFFEADKTSACIVFCRKGCSSWSCCSFFSSVYCLMVLAGSWSLWKQGCGEICKQLQPGFLAVLQCWPSQGVHDGLMQDVCPWQFKTYLATLHLTLFLTLSWSCVPHCRHILLKACFSLSSHCRFWGYARGSLVFYWFCWWWHWYGYPSHIVMDVDTAL